MPAKTATLKSAFRQFVELVKPIEDVECVAAFDVGDAEIFTYIKRGDRAVMREIFRREYRILQDFPECPIDFHVVFLEGRPLEEFVKPLPALAFSRYVMPDRSPPR